VLLNHRLFHFRLQAAPFADALHRRERHLRRNTLVNQVVHDDYCAYFTVRGDGFDAMTMLIDPATIREKIKQIKADPPS